jgi:hypothetical protein
MGILSDYITKTAAQNKPMRIIDFLLTHGEVSKTALCRGIRSKPGSDIINQSLIDMEAMGLISARIARGKTKSTLFIKITDNKPLIEHAKNYYRDNAK